MTITVTITGTQSAPTPLCFSQASRKQHVGIPIWTDVVGGQRKELEGERVNATPLLNTLFLSSVLSVFYPLADESSDTDVTALGALVAEPDEPHASLKTLFIDRGAHPYG